IPPNDPRDQLPQSRIRVGVCAPRNRYHRGELGVTQACQSARDSRDYKGDDDCRPCELRRRLSCNYENTCTNDCANPQRHEVYRSECAFEAVLTFFGRFRKQCLERFFDEKGITRTYIRDGFAELVWPCSCHEGSTPKRLTARLSNLMMFARLHQT